MNLADTTGNRVSLALAQDIVVSGDASKMSKTGGSEVSAPDRDKSKQQLCAKNEVRCLSSVNQEEYVEGPSW
jgi:hypothetical protein